MVPGIPRRFAGKSPAPRWSSALQLLPRRLPHLEAVKQPSSGERGRNGKVLENQPREDEMPGKCATSEDFGHTSPPAASAQWILPQMLPRHEACSGSQGKWVGRKGASANCLRSTRFMRHKGDSACCLMSAYFMGRIPMLPSHSPVLHCQHARRKVGPEDVQREAAGVTLGHP
eukprot:360056-Chlamydomonas_euryale.AAC.23